MEDAQIVIVQQGDVQATLQFVEHIYNYLPEVFFVTGYVLIIYAIVRWINKKI